MPSGPYGGKKPQAAAKVTRKTTVNRMHEIARPLIAHNIKLHDM